MDLVIVHFYIGHIALITAGLILLIRFYPQRQQYDLMTKAFLFLAAVCVFGQVSELVIIISNSVMYNDPQLVYVYGQPNPNSISGVLRYLARLIGGNTQEILLLCLAVCVFKSLKKQ